MWARASELDHGGVAGLVADRPEGGAIDHVPDDEPFVGDAGRAQRALDRPLLASKPICPVLVMQRGT